MWISGVPTHHITKIEFLLNAHVLTQHNLEYINFHT